MRDPLFLLYIIACLVAGKLANRLPIFGANADPRFVHGPAGCLIGLFQLSFVLYGGVLGFLIPKGIAEVVPRDHFNPLYGPTDLDALGRLAQFIGACAGVWLGLRGTWLWVVLMLIGGGIYVVMHMLRWIVFG